MQAGKALAIAGATALIAAGLIAQGRREQPAANAGMTVALGRPTERSITLSVLAPMATEAWAEYGTASGQYPGKTGSARGAAGEPFEIAVGGLQPNTRYYYRLRYRRPGETTADRGAEQTFVTQRAAGSTFTFGVQGDSHPERPGKMFNADLYARTVERVREEQPDFYVMLGDDFSIEPLIARGTLSQPAVDRVYARQRAYLARLTGSTALFLANGNHEEAGQFLLDGTANNAAVLAGRARTRFFPLPEPDDFYTGDTEAVTPVGLLRDYYAWTWGDALFVVMDPYWHSPVQVDADPGGQGGGQADGKQNAARAGRNRDLWAVTIGDAQYAWLKRTLEGSHARYKFLFAHHVLGTGRGAIEVADLYEWGGRDRRGTDLFHEKRPGWEMPIHQLMAKTGVTIFFQGHDHLFAHQQKDGVVYQETPNPADDTYTAFNRDAYRSGDILPNAGHLRVTVSTANVRVEYVRSYLAKDETAEHRDGEVAFSYTVKARDGEGKPGARWSMKQLPDTGQTVKYTTTRGEDADSPIDPQSFTDGGDGTVTDNVTGLMWQQTDGGEMTWENAGEYARRLRLAGHDDWRLPGAHELFSILNRGRNPALDAKYFPRSAAEYWWSADAMAGDPRRIWVTNSGGGIGPHPRNETASAGGSRRFHVRCVRGGQTGGTAPGGRFTANPDGTVTDRATKRMWQQAEAPAMTWEDALRYAGTLSRGGHSDWRLPNIKELQSLSDEELTNPSIDREAFPGARAAEYWSSTTLFSREATRAWVIDLRAGIVTYTEKTEPRLVRAVRGGK